MPLLPADLRRQVEMSAVIGLAGPIAASVWWPSSGYIEPSVDERRVEAVVRLIAPSDKERAALAAADSPDLIPDEEGSAKLVGAIAGPVLAVSYMAFLRAITMELVGAPEFQRRVNRLVPALLEHKTLSARAVRALLNNGGR